MSLILFMKKSMEIIEICENKGIAWKLQSPYAGVPSSARLEVATDPALFKNFVLYSNRTESVDQFDLLKKEIRGGKDANEAKSL